MLFMTYYFIREEDKESGPFTFEQLKTKSIKEDTKIWHAGLNEWTNASNTFGLKQLFQKKLSLQAFAGIKLKEIFVRKKLNFQKKYSGELRDKKI